MTPEAYYILILRRRRPLFLSEIYIIINRSYIYIYIEVQ